MNNWNGMTFTNILQRGFTAFSKRLIALNAFTTDFSSGVAEQGTTFTTRIVRAASGAQDLQTAHSGSRNAAAGDTTTTTVSGTLSHQPISGFHLTDEQAAQIGAGVWSDTLSRKVEKHGYAVADYMLNEVFKVITVANFPSVCFTGPAATFNLDDVMDINQVITDAGFPTDVEDAVKMILKTSYHSSLKKDNAIQNASSFGGNVAATGFLEKADIFPLHQSPTLPPSGSTPASENLSGFVATEDAIAIAQRIVEPQDTESLKFFDVLEDPVTGATMAYRAWYDPDTGKLNHTFETLFGVTKGNSEALQRIVSS